jgi:translation initiation factor IF-2
MSSNTVAEFANELKKSLKPCWSSSRLLAWARLRFRCPDRADKQKLLAYLQASHGTASADRKKITLVKKSTSEIKQADATGKARTIQVEVRKKRTFIKRDEGVEASAPVPERVKLRWKKLPCRARPNWFAARKKPAARLS